MGMSPEDFMAYMAGVQNATEEDLKKGAGKWTPPNGEYQLELTTVEPDLITRKDGTQTHITRLTLTILEGPDGSSELDRRTYEDTMYLGSPNEPATTKGHAQLCRLATLLQGETVLNPLEAYQIVEAAVGVILRAKVQNRVVDSGTTYCNTFYNAVVST